MTYESIGFFIGRITLDNPIRDDKIHSTYRYLISIIDSTKTVHKIDKKLGYDYVEAKERYDNIQLIFKKAHISDCSRVVILLDEENYIRAIGILGKDKWINTTDFSLGTFSDLNIIPTSLILY